MKIPSKHVIKNNRRFAASAAALLLAGTFGFYAGTPSTEAASADRGLFTLTSNTPSSPQWSRSVDSPQAVVGGSAIYYQSGSKLIASDISTGKTKWSYAAKSYAPAVTLNNSVYIATTKGKIVKLNAKNGKVLWTINAPAKPSKSSEEYPPNDFRLSGNTLYISDNKGLTQIDAATGRTIRTLSKVVGKPVGIRGNMIFAVSVSSGAYMRETLKAYDAITGKTLWEVKGDHNAILGISGGYMYTRNIPMSPDRGYAAVIDKVDLKTGKIAKSFNYIPVDYMRGMSANSIVMEGEYFYIVQKGDDSNLIQRISVGAPSETQPEIIAELDKPIIGFQAGSGRIAALLTGGTLKVFDIDTANLRITAAVKKAARTSQIILLNSKVIVQADTTLSVVKIPLGGSD
ncbi:PQQ-binding-like beta-propeller repeat protein [Saccharibacillus deserti]|uniref:outer membrane protein assembly factor BamB family protein n=1 Tax=Saccharibacillus deserti TaxID=1634444 RepID=UPI00155578F3|nr:PQQ-binding-like beta-propeller repeat protein [Saccharibacillus deserti]